MHTSEILADEHRLLGRVLDGFDVLATRADEAGRVELTPAKRVLDFFRRGVDGLHQDKEERALFPQLLARLGRLEVPEVETLAVEHADDRRQLATLGSQLVCAAAGDTFSLKVFVVLGRNYVQELRRHMLEENRTLLPFARRVLTLDDDRAVRAGFRRLEHEHGLAFEPEARRLLAELELAIGTVPVSNASRRLGEV